MNVVIVAIGALLALDKDLQGKQHLCYASKFLGYAQCAVIES